EKAIEEADYDTFTNKLGDIGRLGSGILAKAPVAKFLFLPFYQYGTNAFKFLLTERTPLGLASKDLRLKLIGAQGKAVRDEALAKMAIGTGVLGTVLNWAIQGKLTGAPPKDPVE